MIASTFTLVPMARWALLVDLVASIGMRLTFVWRGFRQRQLLRG